MTIQFTRSAALMLALALATGPALANPHGGPGDFAPGGDGPDFDVDDFAPNPPSPPSPPAGGGQPGNDGNGFIAQGSDRCATGQTEVAAFELDDDGHPIPATVRLTCALRPQG